MSSKVAEAARNLKGDRKRDVSLLRHHVTQTQSLRSGRTIQQRQRARVNPELTGMRSGPRASPWTGSA